MIHYTQLDIYGFRSKKKKNSDHFKKKSFELSLRALYYDKQQAL